MKDLRTVLRQKEIDIARVRHEIQALRIVTALLSNEEYGPQEHTPVPRGALSPTLSEASTPQQRQPFSELLGSWLSGGSI